MEVLMPTIPLDSEALAEARENDEIDDFFLAKLAYINTSSDLDVYQLQGNERIKHLICAWDTGFVLCNRCENDCEKIPDFLQNYLTNLAHYTLSIWFSLEWEKCDYDLCCNLLISMFRMRPRLMELPQLDKFDWDHVMNIGLRPWKSDYFKENQRNFGITDSDVSSLPDSVSAVSLPSSSVEIIEPPAEISDIQHINHEGYILTLLRLMKLFDAGCIESVKRFSICAVSVWNQEQQKLLNSDHVEYNNDLKRCLNMICHTHLMAVFERDSAMGFEIDNMINNIRFYYKCIRDAQNNGKSLDNYIKKAKITPSHLLALTCVRLGQTVQEFIESVLPDLSRETSSTLFGAVSHAYATYLLASILVDMNKFNTEDFIANVEKYKSTMRAYVVERERSERFILEELSKQKLQATSHNVTCTVKEISNLKAAIGKGNRSSNLVNHKPSDIQSEQERAELFEMQNEKRYDPVFQTMPNNEIVTNEFYGVLTKTKYKGWHFAKLVLLLKIIGRELNDIEKWCYHPGLTTKFMMSLEFRLAKHFEHLAFIFEDHIFMEQEFWLTAFYLRPIRVYYDKVIYCGTRFFRTVNFLNKGEREELILKSTDKSDEGSCAFMNAKYGLLSSTFDVKQIANMTCVDTAENDYEVLAKALRTLRLPENIIKDLLTVTFSPRHANFTWAAQWPILRKRCKMLLTNPTYKRELVESNMAEANDRLKYLKVDYDKYKNWPQLDYGSIEEGYENDYIGDDLDDSSDEGEMNEDINKKKGKNKRELNIETDIDDDSEVSENANIDKKLELNSNEHDMGGGNLKRTSARRAAAVIASAMLKEDYNVKVFKKKDEMPTTNNSLAPDKPENISNESENQIKVEPSNEETTIDNSQKLVNELLEYRNSTFGFVPIADLWKHEYSSEIEAQSLEQASSQKMSGVLKNLKTLCSPDNMESEIDESSSECEETFEKQSIHETMNISDTESSYSSAADRSQDGWEQLLPSFIVENFSRSRPVLSSDTGVSSSEKCNDETEIMESDDSVENDEIDEEEDSDRNSDEVVNSDEIQRNVQCNHEIRRFSDENKDEHNNEARNVDEPNINATNDEDQSMAKNKNDIESVQFNWLSAFKEKIESIRELKKDILFPPNINKPIEVLESSSDSSQKVIKISTPIAVVQADCTDSAAERNSIVDPQSASNEASKDDRFVVSTTTTAKEIINDTSQGETETTIDSTANSKTEDNASIDGAASIETITDDSNSRILNKNLSEKPEMVVEVHSTTQNEIPQYQLTGKPKSFTENLSAHHITEDSSSQSTNGTPLPTALCKDSKVADKLEEKRKAELIDRCLNKKCFVPLTRMESIRSSSLEPIVRVKRLNLDRLIKEREETSRENRTSKSKPKNFYTEDHEGNCSPVAHTSRSRKRRSETPVNSESDEEYTPKQSKDGAKPSIMRKTVQRRRSRTKSFSVVPRSASGLKVCISSLCEIRTSTEDCIEISSSSETELMEIANFPLEFASIGSIIIDQDDPLFEEEADINLLR